MRNSIREPDQVIPNTWLPVTEESLLMLPALEKIGQDQHFESMDFFHALIVRQKQSGFPLNSRGDFHGVGQADCVARPNKRRRFRQPFV
jgi:hypothetical protein